MVHTRKLGYLSPCVAGGRVPLLAHFFILILTLLTLSAHAADPLCTSYRVGDQGPWHSSMSAACSAAAAAKTYTGQTASVVSSDPQCVLSVKADGPYPAQEQQFGYETKNDVCEQVCKAGPKKGINVTIGYHATPSQNIKLNPLVKTDPFIKLLLSQGKADMCKSGCKVLVDAPTGDTSWVSQVAGPNGLYRSSVDTTYSPSDVPCSTPAPDAVTASAKPPSCPGSLGTVNGATVCLPSTTDSGVDLGGDASRGNPTAGDVDANKTPAQRAPGPGGAGNGTGTGNSSNGGGPTGGPATGSNNGPGGKGCNDGSKAPTPACSGRGTNDSDGTTTKPPTGKEQQACGAPGQPKCSIDETGTPDGKSVFDKAKSDMDAEWDKKKTELDKFMNGGDKDTSWGVTPSWLHTGGCSPWSLGTLPVINVQINVDICPIKNVVDAVMSFIWAVGTFFAVTSLVFRTTTQSGS